jgi:hypothetical protein
VKLISFLALEMFIGDDRTLGAQKNKGGKKLHWP